MKRLSMIAGLLTTSLLLPLALNPTPTMAQQQYTVDGQSQLKHKEIGKRPTALRPAAAPLQGRFHASVRGRFQRPGSNVRSLTPEEMSEPGPRNPYYGGM